MRLYCRAIQHFLDCHGNISSLKGSHIKAKWCDGIERRHLVRPLFVDLKFSHPPPAFILHFHKICHYAITANAQKIIFGLSLKMGLLNYTVFCTRAGGGLYSVLEN
jgi:hypothetical protein